MTIFALLLLFNIACMIGLHVSRTSESAKELAQTPKVNQLEQHSIGHPYREEQPEQVSLNERVMRLLPLLHDTARDWSAMYLYASKKSVDINIEIKGKKIKCCGKDFEAAIGDMEVKILSALEEQAKAIDADLTKIKTAYKLLKS